MDFRNTAISEMFPTSSIYYDLEALKKLDESEAVEAPQGRVSWLGSKPPVIEGMDKAIRKSFNIPEKFKMVFQLHKPPEYGLKEPILSKPSRKIAQRVVISTIAESPELNLGTGRKQVFKMKGGEAYAIPYPVNNMVTIEFDDKRTLIIPARKGFRQQRRTKRVEKRYIMVFDYIYTDDIQEAVEELALASE